MPPLLTKNVFFICMVLGLLFYIFHLLRVHGEETSALEQQVMRLERRAARLEEEKEKLAEDAQLELNRMKDQFSFVSQEAADSKMALEKTSQKLKKAREQLEEEEKKIEELQEEISTFQQKSDLELAAKQAEIDKSFGLPQILAPPRKVLCSTSYKFDGKPVFVFVVGAEGTGHHLVANLLDKFPRVETLSREVQKLLVEIWEPTINEDRALNASNTLSELLQQASERALKDLMSSDPEVATKAPTHFVVQARDFDMYSFPFDDPRNVLRRPDLRQLIRIVEPHFHVRFIVMVRDETDSIVSLVRRKWWTLEMCQNGVPIPTQRKDLFTTWPLGECGYINVQARVVEDSNTYLAAHLQTISSSLFRVMNYHQLLDDAQVFAAPLLKFLGFGGLGGFPEVEQGGEGEFGLEQARKVLVKHIKKKTEDYSKILGEAQKGNLARIFEELGKEQWAFLHQPELSLAAFDESPLHLEGEVCW